MNVNEWKAKGISVLRRPCRFQTEVPAPFRVSEAAAPRHFHEKLAAYEKTPLLSFPALAKKLVVKGVYTKDESGRFSLNAFKGLGGSYAMFRILCEKFSLDPETASPEDLTQGDNGEKVRQMDFVTCTDGNHGRGVAWAAGLFGCRAHVYMPRGTCRARVEAIRQIGSAEVVVTDKSYDDTVLYAKAMSEKHGWTLIQDTSWEGYEKIPTWIIQGYLTLASEMTEQLEKKSVRPTHVFLQAGVGSMAGGVLGYLADYYGEDKPAAVIVEPVGADCVYLSAKAGDGNIRSALGIADTMMAGLNCGTPCHVTWPILRDFADYYVSMKDEAAASGMRAYAAGLDGDPKVVSGESGASTLGAALRILTDDDLSDAKNEMKLNSDSVVLLINTEGATDPENYRRIVKENSY